VVEANRAVAVAMAEGPAAGLVILDTISGHPQLRRWPQLYLARADLLRRLGRPQEAGAAYRQALELEPPPAERAFIQRRLRQLPPAGLQVQAGAGFQPGRVTGRARVTDECQESARERASIPWLRQRIHSFA